ncbi:MAG: hypothetical protein ABRQ39_30315, partial [Candidatus Eremiobacterota bacterium]
MRTKKIILTLENNNIVCKFDSTKFGSGTISTDNISLWIPPLVRIPISLNIFLESQYYHYLKFNKKSTYEKNLNIYMNLKGCKEDYNHIKELEELYEFFPDAAKNHIEKSEKTKEKLIFDISPSLYCHPWDYACNPRKDILIAKQFIVGRTFTQFEDIKNNKKYDYKRDYITKPSILIVAVPGDNDIFIDRA